MENMTREEYLALRATLDAYQGDKEVSLEKIEEVTEQIREGEGQGNSKTGKKTKKKGWWG
jgi:hypothetical protein